MTQIERFERRCKQKVSEGTADRYVRAVRQFDEWLEDAEVIDADEYEIEDYLLELSADGYSGSTIKIALAGIKKFFQESRQIDENPADEVSIGGWSVVKEGTKRSQELGTDVHYLEVDKIQTLVDNVPSPKFRNELILKLLFQTGLRGGELVSVKLSQVDVENRSIDINADKNHQNRTVYYQPSLATKMKIWIEAERPSTIYASESDYLFPTNYAEHLTRHGLDNMFTKAVENAGMDEPLYTDAGGKEISRVTPHSLRHSFAVHSLRRGMDVRTLQELLGHADIETTQVYLDLAKDDVKEKARRFGPSLES